MSGLVVGALDKLRSYAGEFAWQPLIQLSRTAVLGLMSKVETGQIIVREAGDVETICGRENEGADLWQWPQTELRVLRDVFWLRVALFADMVRLWRPLIVV